DAQFHFIEQGAAGLGADELRVQPPGLKGGRVLELHTGVRVLADVALGLVEELAAQRDVPVIEIVDVAEVGHVGRALRVAGDDGSRHHALEAGHQLAQAGHATSAPALGPGVASNTPVSSNSAAIRLL